MSSFTETNVNPSGRPASLDDRLITDREGAALIGCSRATWWRRTADGTLPQPLRIGGLTRWRMSDVQKLLERLEPVDPSSAQASARERGGA